MNRPVLVCAALGVAGFSIGSWGCDARKSPVEPTPVCTTAITPASRDFPDDGGTSTIAVTTPAGCSWTASTPLDWLVITSATTGTGPGTVAYSVRPNATADPRTGVLSVEGQAHTVRQAGRTPAPCTTALTPRSTAVGKDASDGGFDVDTRAECAWSAVSTASWVAVTSAAQGSGPGRVTYAIARNPDLAARDASILVGDATFAIHQAGDPGVPGALNGVWHGRLLDYPGGRSFQMTLAMRGDRVTGTITGDGTGGGGFMTGVYGGSGPVHLVADFGDGKQYFDGASDGPDRIRGTSTYNQRPPVYQFEMTK